MGRYLVFFYVVLLLLVVGNCAFAISYPPGDIDINLSGIELLSGMFVVAAASVWGVRKALGLMRP